MRVFSCHNRELQVKCLLVSDEAMTGANLYLGPASETYAGFAWDYLRRNIDYCHDYQRIESSLRNEFKAIRYGQAQDSKAHKYGLECFAAPQNDGLKALVIWRQEAFPGALSVHYHAANNTKNSDQTFRLSNFDCDKQHFVKTNGTRITVIKSPHFWLQLAGKPADVEAEDQSFSVLIDGGKGSRRRIDALRQLTSLSRDGSHDFKLLGRQKAFTKMRNALLAYDIRAHGGSYRDVAIALFGAERVDADWNTSGGFLKGRAIRSYKFGERMVAQDYQSLLPKKTL